MPDLNHNDPLSRLVRSLPEDSPSMTWRAGLNEKLRAEATRRVKVRRWGFGSLGLGLATACFAALMIVPTMLGGSQAIPTRSFVSNSSGRPVVPAADLLQIDGEGATVAEVSGAGLAARENDLTEGEVQYVLASQML